MKVPLRSCSSWTRCTPERAVPADTSVLGVWPILSMGDISLGTLRIHFPRGRCLRTSSKLPNDLYFLVQACGNTHCNSISCTNGTPALLSLARQCSFHFPRSHSQNVPFFDNSKQIPPILPIREPALHLSPRRVLQWKKESTKSCGSRSELLQQLIDRRGALILHFET